MADFIFQINPSVSLKLTRFNQRSKKMLECGFKLLKNQRLELIQKLGLKLKLSMNRN